MTHDLNMEDLPDFLKPREQLEKEAFIRERGTDLELDEELDDALSKLNSQRRRFVQEVASGEVSQKVAAIRAGYSKPTAYAAACGLMKKPDVAHALKLQRKQYALLNGISQAWMRERLVRIIDESLEEGDSKNRTVAISALRTLCEIDGSFAAVQLKHSHLNVSISLDYQIDMPERGATGNLIEGEVVPESIIIEDQTNG